MKPSLGMIVHTQKVIPILFVLARAYRVFRPCVSGSTLGAPLGAFGTLGVTPWLIPPHSAQKPYTNSPPSSIVTIPTINFILRNLTMIPDRQAGFPSCRRLHACLRPHWRPPQRRLRRLLCWSSCRKVKMLCLKHVKQEGNVLRTLRPSMFQTFMGEILHSLVQISMMS